MNGIIIIDKPKGWTSHDVVAKLRGALRVKKVGHGGTLDPLATGVLPIFIGTATKKSSLSIGADKEYIAGMILGKTTDTQDISGKVLSDNMLCGSALDAALVRLNEVLPHFLGAQKQIPPMYSAKKHGGKKLYELARAGVEVAREPKDITIFELERIDSDSCDAVLRVLCSKGTYIRTLCADIGDAIGTGAVMAELRRTRSGNYRIEDTHTLDTILSAISDNQIDKLLIDT